MVSITVRPVICDWSPHLTTDPVPTTSSNLCPDYVCVNWTQIGPTNSNSRWDSSPRFHLREAQRSTMPA